MRNKLPTRRRASVYLAALSALVMSSGLALIVAASPASAKTPVNICHATSSDTNPYVFITVDDDSAKFKGHLKHREEPNKTWKNAGTYEGVAHAAGDPKPDLIGDFVDDQGQPHTYDGNITSASCDEAVVEVPPAVADVEFVEPECENDNTASWEGTGDHVEFALTDGTVGPGNTIEVTATADDGYFFENEETTQVFEHTFDEAEAPCEIVNPPKQVAPDVSFVDPTCDTDPAVILPDPTPVTTAPPTDIAIPERAAAGPVIQTEDIDGVHYEVTGTLAPGGTVEVDATPLQGFEFPQGATTHWEHTFSMPEGCTVVEPPVVDPPEAETETETPVATPTVVSAGLEPDLRSQQGLALLFGGAILLVAAGALGLSRPRETSQI